MPRWESCPATMLIEGRGPVRCWFPPRPGHMLCPAHDPGPDPVDGESELRAMLSALLKQLHTEAEMSDFVRLSGGPHYELRVGVSGGVAKWVIVPEGIVRRAPVDLPTHRVLRDFLAAIIHESCELRGNSGEQQALPSRRLLPAPARAPKPTPPLT
jgi:hypothetical protein